MKRMVAVAVLAVCVPSLGAAQDKMPKLQLGIVGSSLGLGAELTVGVHPMIEFRGVGHWFKYERAFDIDDVDYDVTAKWKNGSVLLDLHPFKNALRLTGGVTYNGNEIRARGNIPTNISVEVGDEVYTGADIDSLVGVFDFKKAAPYAGLGFSGSGKISFSFDLGIVFQGTPRVSYDGSTQLTGPAEQVFNDAVEAERLNIQAELDDQQVLKYYPVLSLGLKYRFR